MRPVCATSRATYRFWPAITGTEPTQSSSNNPKMPRKRKDNINREGRGEARTGEQVRGDDRRGGRIRGAGQGLLPPHPHPPPSSPALSSTDEPRQPNSLDHSLPFFASSSASEVYATIGGVAYSNLRGSPRQKANVGEGNASHEKTESRKEESYRSFATLRFKVQVNDSAGSIATRRNPSGLQRTSTTQHSLVGGWKQAPALSFS